MDAIIGIGEAVIAIALLVGVYTTVYNIKSLL